jgi:hypothetical protein
MTDPSPGTAVAHFALTAARAQDRVRDLAQLSANVIFTDHAFERMEERSFNDIDVLRVLRTGFVEELPTDVGHGNWQCKVVRRMPNGREAGVITIILVKGKLLVRTVEWEDGR